MDSKVDKQIKRYLKRISDTCSEADTYNSTYYVIDYGDGVRATVRFSDHIKSQTKALLDIVKMNSDVYIIAIRQMKYSVPADRVVSQLKSLMLYCPRASQIYKYYG